MSKSKIDSLKEDLPEQKVPKSLDELYKIEKHENTETQNKTQEHIQPKEQARTIRKKRKDTFENIIKAFNISPQEKASRGKSTRLGIDILHEHKIKINNMTNAYYSRTGMRLTIKQLLEHAIGKYIDENYNTFLVEE